MGHGRATSRGRRDRLRNADQDREGAFLDDVTIVEAPLLRPYSAFCINTDEVYTRWKRNIFWNQHGSRGDAVEGEWISEPSIQVENEPHHAWVEGITAFSAN